MTFNWLLQYPDWYFWAALPALMVHQAEEFVWPGGFQSWYHTAVLKDRNHEKPLFKRAAFIVNVPIGWSLFAAAGWVGSSALWFSLPVLSILFINAWFHIVLSLTHNEYVPGTNTSILLHLPLTVYAYYHVLITWQAGFALLMSSIMAGLILHMIFLAVARGSLEKHEDDEQE